MASKRHLVVRIIAASGWIACIWPSHIDDWMNQNLTRYFMNVNENLMMEIMRRV